MCSPALCAEPCANGGTCLKPNKCACPPGWTGHRCQTGTQRPHSDSPEELYLNPYAYSGLAFFLSFFFFFFFFTPFFSRLSDVDECGGRQPCAQLCVNTAGSYRCACRDGFALAGDGRSCHQFPPPPPSPSPTPTQGSRAAVGGHADAGKRAPRPAYFHVLQQDRGRKHDQLRGPLLLLVRAMPLSTRTVSNNALRLVPTPD